MGDMFAHLLQKLNDDLSFNLMGGYTATKLFGNEAKLETSGLSTESALTLPLPLT